MTQKLRKVGKPQNLYIEAMQSIKESIFRGDYPPGQALPNETDLAGLLGVSRPVVREALRVLQNQGFLVVKRGSKGGTYVTDLSKISIKDNLEDLLRMGKISMDDFTQARLLLEPEVFRLAAQNATDEQLEEMSELIQRARVSKDVKRRIEIESDFHRLVAKASGSPLYIRFMQIIFEFVEVFSITTKSLDFGIHEQDEHLEIFEALSERDGETASRLARNHAEKVNRGMIKIEKKWYEALSE